MPIRISGMNSGLDTEAIIEAMVSAYSTKADKYKKAQTKITYKQDAWKALNTKVYSLYSSVGNLRLSTAYNMKKTNVSDSSKATVTAGAQAVSGTQSLKIKTLAKAGYLTGAKLGSTTTASTKLSALGTGITDEGTINVKVGTETKAIKVNADDTVESVVNKLKDAGVSANYDANNQRIFVSSSKTGKENDFTITAGDETGLKALANLGLMTSTAADRAAYDGRAAMVNYSKDSDGVIQVADSEWTALEGKINATKDAYLAKKNAEADKATKQNELAEARKKDGYLTSSPDAINAAKDKIAENPDDETVKAENQQKIVTELRNLMSASGKTFADYGLDEDIKDEDLIDKFDDGSVDMEQLITDVNADAQLEASTISDSIFDLENEIASLDSTISSQNTILNDNKDVVELLGESNILSSTTDDLMAKAKSDILTAIGIKEGTIQMPATGNSEEDRAVKIDGEDAEITLNGAKFVSSSNTFSINGLSIQAKAVTKDDEIITLTTDTDVDGLYDKIKDFLSQYNSVINELSKVYNAESAKGYEPLTDEEKDSMSDKEVEKWEQKIRDSVLRRDSTLGSLISTMTTSMMKSYTGADGKSYSLSSFGIQTLGYLNSSKNENYAYHIDGDPDDENSSGKTDKLRAALTADPDSVINFMKDLTSNLYKEIDGKMKSTSISSAYTIYNDKEMASEYSSYKDLISKWTQKVTDMEDKYYKQFAAMEKALANMQSNSSSVTSLLG